MHCPSPSPHRSVSGYCCPAMRSPAAETTTWTDAQRSGQVKATAHPCRAACFESTPGVAYCANTLLLYKWTGHLGTRGDDHQRK
nr:unnamed protein product [Digitaria exilis]